MNGDMQILLITAEIEEACKQLATWAAQPENWYDLEAGVSGQILPPGGDARYVRQFGYFRCVFSVTHYRTQKQLFRHLSISVADPEGMPALEIAFELAKLFGFTGAPQDWGIGEGVRAPGEHRHGVVMQDMPYTCGEA